MKAKTLPRTGTDHPPHSMRPLRRQVIRACLGAGAALGVPARFAGAHASHGDTGHDQHSPDYPLIWRERTLLGFGTSLWLRAAHTDPARVNAGLDAAVSAIRHVEAQMNLFDPDSALSTLNRTGVLRNPHPDMVRVLTIARQVARASNGAFDVTVQPLWQAWARASKTGKLPSKQALTTAQARIDWRGLNVSAQRIDFAQANMAVTLNGIAQGFAADLATAALAAHGIEHALLDTGEWSAMGHGPDNSPWTLGVENPATLQGVIARLQTDGRAIASSAQGHYKFSDDARHHHILDPRTGYSPPQIASVTIAAPSCALADALTKVFFMAKPEQIMQLARRWQVDVLVVTKDGNWQASQGLHAVPA